MTPDPARDPARIGVADVDAAASTSWVAVAGPWLSLLPMTVLVGIVALAVTGWIGVGVVVLVALGAGTLLRRPVSR